MTVYEMIQELSQYEADQEVEINVVAEKYRATVEVEEDLEKGDETDVDIEIDEDVTEFYIDERKMYGKQNVVRINVELE